MESLFIFINISTLKCGIMVHLIVGKRGGWKSTMNSFSGIANLVSVGDCAFSIFEIINDDNSVTLSIYYYVLPYKTVIFIYFFIFTHSWC